MSAQDTVTVTVRLFGGLREASGVGSLSVSLQRPGRLSDLTSALGRLLPQAAQRLSQGLSQGYVHVLVDGRDVDLLAGDDPPLADGASVVFVPPIGGG